MKARHACTALKPRSTIYLPHFEYLLTAAVLGCQVTTPIRERDNVVDPTEKFFNLNGHSNLSFYPFPYH